MQYTAPFWVLGALAVAMTSDPARPRRPPDSATTRAMRVVYASSIDRFGPLSHLRDLAPAVAREGAEVKVLCLDEAVAASFRALGVEAAATPLGVEGATYVAPRPSGGELAGADVVHTHDPRTGLLVRPQGVRTRAEGRAHLPRSPRIDLADGRCALPA